MKRSQRSVVFQEKYFDSSTCSVSWKNEDDRTVLGDFSIGDDIIKLLSGALSGSSIHVELKTWTESELEGEEAPDGLLMTISNPEFLSEPNRVVLFVEHNSRSTILAASVYLKLVMFKRNPDLKGVAGHMIHRVVEGANQLPNPGRIKLLAEGGRLSEDMPDGERWGGYMAWPKYGFDTAIPDMCRALFPLFSKFPKGLDTCLQVSDLLDKEGGKDLWSVVGVDEYMEFDLSAGSNSMNRLEKFVSDF